VMASLIDYLETKCPSTMTVAPVLYCDSSGDKYLRIDFCYSGQRQTDVDNLLAISGLITWDNVRPWVFKEWQSAFDSSFLPPMRGFWKASYVKHVPRHVQLRLIDSFSLLPSTNCSILIEHLHGAFKQKAANDAAFPLREANFGILFSARWPTSDSDNAHIKWVRHSYRSI